MSKASLARPPVHLLLLTIVALAAYSNTFSAPLVFDDISSIVENPVIKTLSDFVSGAGYAYNPRRFVGYLTFALNYRLSGLDVTGFHIVNLAIHIINAWLVYFMVRLTLRTPFFQVSGFWFLVSSSTTRNQKPETRNLVPLLAALLFVAHPVQTQAVTYVVQRLASLATLFYLASLVFYIKVRLMSQVSSSEFKPETRNQKPETFFFFILSLISAILAMRTKEIAATLPIVVLLYEFSFFGAGTRKKLLFLVPFLLTLLIIPIGMLHAGKPLGELLSDVSEMARESRTISRGDYLLTQFAVIVTYIRLLFFPATQNLDYDYPVYHSFFTPRVFLSFLLLCSILGVAVWLYRRSTFYVLRSTSETQNSELKTQNSPPGTERLAAFGILWFFITLSVESSVIPISDVIFEHRLYLPSVGAFIAIAALIPLVFSKYPERTLITAAIVVAAILSIATWQRNLVWKSHLMLWNDVVSKSPQKARPHNNLGAVLVSLGRIDEAIEHFLASLKLSPSYAHAHNNLGDAYYKKGWDDGAVEEHKMALKLKPDFAEAHNNLGAVYIRKGWLERAIEEYKIALKIKPLDGDFHFNLGVAYEKVGRPEKAIEEYRLTVMLRPEDREAHNRLAAASSPHRDSVDDDAQVHHARANDLVSRELVDEGIREYEAALRLRTDFAEAHNNLGVAYGMKGEPGRAMEHIKAAIRLKPDEPDYHHNLARAYDMKGWTAKAEEERRLAEELGRRRTGGK